MGCAFQRDEGGRLRLTPDRTPARTQRPDSGRRDGSVSRMYRMCRLLYCLLPLHICMDKVTIPMLGSKLELLHILL